MEILGKKKALWVKQGLKNGWNGRTRTDDQ